VTPGSSSKEINMSKLILALACAAALSACASGPTTSTAAGSPTGIGPVGGTTSGPVKRAETPTDATSSMGASGSGSGMMQSPGATGPASSSQNSGATGATSSGGVAVPR
jgi:hypothetical protein